MSVPLTLLDNQTRVSPGAFFPQLGGGGGSSISSFNTASVSSLTVSTLTCGIFNGQLQTFSNPQGIALPANTSTVIGQVPLGNFNYQLTIAGGGNAYINAGMGSQAFFNPLYVGGLSAPISAGSSGPSPVSAYLTNASQSTLYLGVANATGTVYSMVTGTIASTA